VNGSEVSLSYVAPLVCVEFPSAIDSHNVASFIVDFDTESGNLADTRTPFAGLRELRGVRKPRRGLRQFHLVGRAPSFSMNQGSVGGLNLGSSSKMSPTPPLDASAGPPTSVQL
jgi:hypothetical protein